MGFDEHNHHTPQKSPEQKDYWRQASHFVAFIIIAIIGYYLITEHKAHVIAFLGSFPWWILLFLLCPLMHFMHGHGGHGKHEEHHKHKEENENSPEKKGVSYGTR